MFIGNGQLEIECGPVQGEGRGGIVPAMKSCLRLMLVSTRIVALRAERALGRVILVSVPGAFGLRLRVRLARWRRHHGRPPFCRN